MRVVQSVASWSVARIRYYFESGPAKRERRKRSIRVQSRAQKLERRTQATSTLQSSYAHVPESAQACRERIRLGHSILFSRSRCGLACLWGLAHCTPSVLRRRPVLIARHIAWTATAEAEERFYKVQTFDRPPEIRVCEAVHQSKYDVATVQVESRRFLEEKGKNRLRVVTREYGRQAAGELRAE